MRIAYYDKHRKTEDREVIVEADTLDGLIQGLKLGTAKKKAIREAMTEGFGLPELKLYLSIEMELSVIETVA